MKDNKKIKKLKFVCFNHLKIATTLNNFTLYMIPFYKVEINKDDIISLNMFKEFGELNICKIRWVKITVPKSVIENIDLSKYKYKDKKVKKVKPEQKLENILTEMIGIMMPVEIFNMLIHSKIYIMNNSTLESILINATAADSIKLLDKDKKFLAYVLPDIDQLI